MRDGIVKLKDLHEKMNGETGPLEDFFQSCPDFMLMFENEDRRIRHVNGTVVKTLGWGKDAYQGKPITDFLVIEGEDPLPNGRKGHSRFFAKLLTKTGETILLDFNSTYLSDGDITIITGRYPLTG
jgi:PAS domain-containing protein